MIHQMYDTNRNHQDWDKAESTCLICKIDDNNTVNLEDRTIGEEDTHAEEFLLQELDKKSEVRNVTVFMNNSPCSTTNHACTDKLLKYLDANENVRLTMCVTSLYMIARESCKKDGHSEVITNEAVHSAGLKRLKQHARCEINAFNKNVWEELLNITKMSQEFKEELLNITEMSQEFKEELLNITKMSQEFKEELLNITKISQEFKEELLNITKMSQEFKEEFMSKYCNVKSRKEEDDCIRSGLETI